MVEGARLESVYTGNRIEGSNPFLSAKERKLKHAKACFLVILQDIKLALMSRQDD